MSRVPIFLEMKNTIRDGGSTTLYAANTVDTVYTVYTVDMVYTVYTVDTVDMVYDLRFKVSGNSGH